MKIEIDRETFHLMMRELSSRHARDESNPAKKAEIGDKAAFLADATAAQTAKSVLVET